MVRWILYGRKVTGTDMGSRLMLTEGVFTVLLGIATYFFLPDCKAAKITPS